MVEVRDVPDSERFEILVGGSVAGFLQYHRRPPDTFVAIHTEIAREYAGQGLAGRLVQHVLDQARAEGLRVKPECPFVAAYVDKHPEYHDLVLGHTAGGA
ncbi:MAG: GNAT family N-acetyltransferase [Nocardioidaceae bacterium]